MVLLKQAGGGAFVSSPSSVEAFGGGAPDEGACDGFGGGAALLGGGAEDGIAGRAFGGALQRRAGHPGCLKQGSAPAAFPPLVVWP